MMEDLRCPLCQDLFSGPVSVPCGHNFCQRCLDGHWIGPGPHNCPVCGRSFCPRPQLQVNAFISAVVERYRDQNRTGPGPGSASSRTGPEPGSASSRTRPEPVYFRVEPKISSKPDPGPEPGTRTQAVPVYSGAGPYTLMSRQVQRRQAKVQELQAVLEQSQRTADLKAAQVVRTFGAVVEEVQKSLDSFSHMIEETQRRTQDQVQTMVQELDHEIQELRDREAQDQHIYIYGQSSPRPALRDLREWDSMFVELPPFDQQVAQVVVELEERVGLRLRPLLETPSLRRLRDFAVSLTFDPKTVGPPLELSPDLKELFNREKSTKRRTSPKSFQIHHAATRQSFTCGRFYFEVQVRGKTDWQVGVARRSALAQKKLTFLCPALGFWALGLRDGTQCSALLTPPEPLVLKRPLQKLGVFVDYDPGLVSFYDADSGHLLRSFSSCSFREEIVPLLCPGPPSGGRNSAPLALTRVPLPHETRAPEAPREDPDRDEYLSVEKKSESYRRRK